MIFEKIKEKLIAGDALINVLVDLGFDDTDVTEDMVNRAEDIVHEVFDMQLDKREFHEIVGWSWDIESRVGVSDDFHSALLRILKSKNSAPQSIASSKS